MDKEHLIVGCPNAIQPFSNESDMSIIYDDDREVLWQYLDRLLSEGGEENGGSGSKNVHDTPLACRYRFRCLRATMYHVILSRYTIFPNANAEPLSHTIRLDASSKGCQKAH